MTPPVVDEKALLPCPFCGASAHYLHRAIGIRGTMGYDWWHSIQCNSCNAAVGYDDNRYRDKDDAAKAWNTRRTPQPVYDEKAYALAAHLKGFEAHIFGEANHKQFRDEMRMLLDMIKNPPYATQPDLYKLIGQMEGMKSEALAIDSHVVHNETIDRCIALVRGMVSA